MEAVALNVFAVNLPVSCHEMPGAHVGFLLRYRNIIQRAVAPHAQSLCFTAQRRQSQYSHQIHFR